MEKYRVVSDDGKIDMIVTKTIHHNKYPVYVILEDNSTASLDDYRAPCKLNEPIYFATEFNGRLLPAVARDCIDNSRWLRVVELTKDLSSLSEKILTKLMEYLHKPHEDVANLIERALEDYYSTDAKIGRYANNDSIVVIDIVDNCLRITYIQHPDEDSEIKITFKIPLVGGE